MWNAWERRGIHTGVWFESLKEGDRLEDLDVDERMAFRWRLKKLDGRERFGIFGVHRMRAIS
jgi:hypothetical protein